MKHFCIYQRINIHKTPQNHPEYAENLQFCIIFPHFNICYETFFPVIAHVVTVIAHVVTIIAHVAPATPLPSKAQALSTPLPSKGKGYG